jgi:cytochrome c biogenesis protein CcdA
MKARTQKSRITRTAGIVLILLALDYLLLLGIGLLLTKTFKGEGWLTAEDDLNTDLAHNRDKALTDASYVGSGLGNTAAIVGALIVVAIALAVAMRKLRPSMFLVVAVAGQALVFLCVQFAVKRPRAPVPQVERGIPKPS